MTDTKLVATRKADQNRAVIDPWTIVHFSAGLALGLVSAPRSASFAAALLYEIAEQWAERNDVGQDLFEVKGPESAPNAVLDVLVFMGGHYLGELWNRR
jgi:hypothetical protein